MKTKVLKFLTMITVVFILFSIKSNNVYASEASISANNCNVGESFTVTVNIPQDAISYQGTIRVTYSDGSTDSSQILGLGQNLNDLTADYYWPGNASKTFTAKVAGNATVSVVGLILNNASSQQINSTTTLTTAITISDSTPAPAASSSDDSGSSGNSSQPAAPTAPVNLTFSDGNEKMYTNKRVNIRQSYGTNSLIIQTLPEGTELIRTGVSNGKADGYSWSRVSYNGITGYVITGALTTDAPAVTELDEEEPEKIEETEEELEESEEELEENQEENQEDIERLKEELGTIPEVGVNIMPYFFLGCVISCIVMMYEIKLKKQ